MVLKTRKYCTWNRSEATSNGEWHEGTLREADRARAPGGRPGRYTRYP